MEEQRATFAAAVGRERVLSLLVWTLGRPIGPVEVSAEDSIGALKARLGLARSAATAKLYWHGAVLGDAMSLRDCGIFSGAVLTLAQDGCDVDPTPRVAADPDPHRVDLGQRGEDPAPRKAESAPHEAASAFGTFPVEADLPLREAIEAPAALPSRAVPAPRAAPAPRQASPDLVGTWERGSSGITSPDEDFTSSVAEAYVLSDDGSAEYRAFLTYSDGASDSYQYTAEWGPGAWELSEDGRFSVRCDTTRRTGSQPGPTPTETQQEHNLQIAWSEFLSRYKRRP